MTTEPLTIARAEVGSLRSRVADRGGRPRVALVEPPPTMIALDRAAVGRLNFQPRVCVEPMPCIASRHGDVVTLRFDAAPGAKTVQYRCHPVKWVGHDDIDDTLIVGVHVDTAAQAAHV